MSDPAELILRRTAADYAALQKQLRGEMAAKNAPSRVLYWGSAIVAGAIALVTVYLATGAKGRALDPLQFVLLVLAFFGAWSLMNWLAAPLLKKVHPRLNIFCAPTHLTMTDTALRLRGQGYDNAYDWSVITGVVETADHMFVRVDGTTSLVVPRRDFAGPAQCAAFLQNVRAHIGAQPGSTP